MYERMELRRSYFSAFQPVTDTPFSGLSRTPLLREHRLYQMDWLLRIYKFDLKELSSVFNSEGNLPLGLDPKYVYARETNVLVDPNEATREELLRVPGIGPISASRIMTIRKFGPLTQDRLKRAGVVVKRALPFLKMGGQQMRLSDFKTERIPIASKVVQ
jgi:predicted DNA-binding helix-hairpin-helix protein